MTAPDIPRMSVQYSVKYELITQNARLFAKSTSV